MLMAHMDPLDVRGRYLHWDEMRRRTPPGGLTHEQWWLATTLTRRSASIEFPLTSTTGQPFRFSNVEPAPSKNSQTASTGGQAASIRQMRCRRIFQRVTDI